MSRSWPPPVGARLRNAAGDELIVTAQHGHRDLGAFIVVKRTFPGGWECYPVSREQWRIRLGLQVAPVSAPPDPRVGRANDKWGARASRDSLEDPRLVG